jgi:hypothetical protein
VVEQRKQLRTVHEQLQRKVFVKKRFSTTWDILS